MLVTHITQLAGTTVAGLLVSPLGIGVFGVFGLVGLLGPIVLILLLANLFGGRSRAHGEPSGRGLVIGFMVVFIAMLAVDAARG
jgi:hypothetical protein